MKVVEIVCESCERSMSLGRGVLTHIAGRTGRVSCQGCGNRIVFDARHEELRVLQGGFQIESSDELVQESEEGIDDRPLNTRDATFASLYPSALLVHSSSQESELARRNRLNTPRPPLKRGREQKPAVHEAFPPSAADLLRSPSTRPVSPALVASSRLPPIPTPPSAHVRGKVPPPPRTLLSARPLSQAGPTSVPVPSEHPGSERHSEVPVLTSLRPKATSSFSSWAVAASLGLALGTALGANQLKLDAPSWSLLGAGDGEAVDVDGGRLAPTKGAASFARAELPLAGEHAQLSARVESPIPPAPGVEAVHLEELLDEPAPRAVQDSPPLVRRKSKSDLAPVPQVSVPSLSPSASNEANANDPEVGPKTEDVTEIGAIEEELSLVPAPFSPSLASGALVSAASIASGSCLAEGESSGRAKVTVTFAPSGRVTQALVSGAPFAGTPTGSCLAAQFRSVRIAAFTGEHVTVSKTVRIR